MSEPQNQDQQAEQLVKQVIAPPPQITINPTNRCIYQCRHCDRKIIPGEPELSLLTASKFLSEIAERYGPRIINIAGGEPLLYGPLVDLIAHAHEVGHVVTVVTNGALLTPRIARDFNHWGLDQLVMSLDGFEEEHDALRTKNAYRRAMEGIDYLAENAPRVGLGVICVINKLNLPILLEFTKHTLTLPKLQVLNFQALVSHRAHLREKSWYLENELWPTDLNLVNETLDALAQLSINEPQLINPPEQFTLMKAYFADPSRFVINRCLSWKKIINVEGNGDVKYCQGVKPLGNLNRISFSEIWESDENLKRLEQVLDCRTVCHYLVNCGFVTESLQGSDLEKLCE